MMWVTIKWVPALLLPTWRRCNEVDHCPLHVLHASARNQHCEPHNLLLTCIAIAPQPQNIRFQGDCSAAKT